MALDSSRPCPKSKVVPTKSTQNVATAGSLWKMKVNLSMLLAVHIRVRVAEAYLSSHAVV